VSGFFGIGGGFLIVPGLMYAAHLPILEAVGSALVAVAAFGLTTAVNYARSGWIDWPLAAVFIGGGALGGAAGTRLARRLAARQGMLNRVYAAAVFLVALYMIFRTATGGPELRGGKPIAMCRCVRLSPLAIVISDVQSP
jgi:uncharacterized membrane protein YfcA